MNESIRELASFESSKFMPIKTLDLENGDNFSVMELSKELPFLMWKV